MQRLAKSVLLKALRKILYRSVLWQIIIVSTVGKSFQACRNLRRYLAIVTLMVQIRVSISCMKVAKSRNMFVSTVGKSIQACRNLRRYLAIVTPLARTKVNTRPHSNNFVAILQKLGRYNGENTLRLWGKFL